MCCGNPPAQSATTRKTSSPVPFVSGCAAGFVKKTYTGPAKYVVTSKGNAYGQQVPGAVICIKSEDASDPLFN